MGDSAASAGSDPAAPGSYDAQMREMQAIQQSVQRVLEWARRNQVEKVELLAPVPTQENTGDRERKTPSSGDEEFFLDEFDTTSTFTTSASDNKRRLNEDAGKDPQKPPGSLKGRIVVPVQSTAKSLASVGGGGLAASSGSKGSLCVRLLLKKQEAVSFTAAVESCEEGGRLTGQWNRAVFMRSARSAKQQAEAEMAAQVWWGQKFAAGRLHSIIRCDDEIDKIDGEAEDSFSLLNGGSGGKAALPATRGKPLCSHPGCAKLVQCKGKCIAHGGVRECKESGCTAPPRWRGRCAEHGGRHICAEEGCEKLAQSRGKCIEHGGGGDKQCTYPDCTKRPQKRGLCASHGGYLTCKFENCDRRAASKGLCRLHGGTTACKSEGCDKTSQNRGYCYKHGVENGVIKMSRKAKCKVDECLKIQLCQGYCSRHAKERGFTVGRTCKIEGCTRVAQARGCCSSHGGGTRCKYPGCGKSIISKGLCSAHGGRKTCKVVGCEKWGLSAGDIKGYCVEHGGGYRCKHPGCSKSVQYKGLCCTHGGKLTCEVEGCTKTVRVKGLCSAHRRATS